MKHHRKLALALVVVVLLACTLAGTLAAEKSTKKTWPTETRTWPTGITTRPAETFVPATVVPIITRIAIPVIELVYLPIVRR